MNIFNYTIFSLVDEENSHPEIYAIYKLNYNLNFQFFIYVQILFLLTKINFGSKKNYYFIEILPNIVPINDRQIMLFCWLKFTKFSKE